MSGPSGGRSAAPLPCRGSVHLDVLVAELDELAGLLRVRLRDLDPDAVAARRRVEDAATVEATLLLDGALRATEEGGVERTGTWLDALGGAAAAAGTGRDAGGDSGADSGGESGADSGGDATLAVDDAELARLSALERAGAVAGIAADDLSAAFGRDSADAAGLGTALGVLHGRMTAGLVAEERAGRLRRGPRVVHDASVGRVLYFPTDPALLPDAWDGLLRHVTGSGAGGSAARLPAAVRAGLLQLELVRHQPFDAANGRLARAAARLALQSDGLLPGGLGVPDAVLADDPLGYHEEVAASARRRDATAWVERMLEAHGHALRRTIDALDADGAGHRAGRGGSDGMTHEVPAGLEAAFTLGDVATLLDVDTATARARCSTWVVAGAVRRVVGSSGLRLVRTEGQAEGQAAA